MGEARAVPHIARAAAVLLAGVSLVACASVEPRYPVSHGQAQTAPPKSGAVPQKPPQTRPPPQAQGSYKIGKPYQVKGIWYTPREEPDYDEVGIASWYGDAFHLRPTASGEAFDMYMPSAAHKTLPLQSLVEVTNLENGRRIQVRVNDRGPFVDGRIIDLSRAAAEELGMLRSGVARVRVRFVGVAGSKPQPPIVIASAPKAAAKPPVVAAMAPIPNPPEADSLTSLGGSFEVQAAAFTDPSNAEKVRRLLADSGQVEIRPQQRGDGVLYRVVVCSLTDETAALAMRERLAAQGFIDARVIRPL